MIIVAKAFLQNVLQLERGFRCGRDVLNELKFAKSISRKMTQRFVSIIRSSLAKKLEVGTNRLNSTKYYAVTLSSGILVKMGHHDRCTCLPTLGATFEDFEEKKLQSFPWCDVNAPTQKQFLILNLRCRVHCKSREQNNILPPSTSNCEYTPNQIIILSQRSPPMNSLHEFEPTIQRLRFSGSLLVSLWFPP